MKIVQSVQSPQCHTKSKEAKEAKEAKAGCSNINTGVFISARVAKMAKVPA